jgi:hypothetical protein
MKNKDWLNNTITGQFHKQLMELEEEYGIPDTLAKQESFLSLTFYKALNIGLKNEKY